MAASCQGESNATAVEGFCFVDASPISSPGPTDSSFRDRNFTSTVIIAVCAAVAGVLLACLAFLVIYKRLVFHEVCWCQGPFSSFHIVLIKVKQYTATFLFSVKSSGNEAIFGLHIFYCH